MQLTPAQRIAQRFVSLPVEQRQQILAKMQATGQSFRLLPIVPARQGLARIPLSARVTDALLNHHGPYVSYLDVARHMEDLHAMGDLPLICHTHDFRVDDVNRALIRMLCHVRHNPV